MPARNDPGSFGWVSRLIHWITAALVLTGVPLGLLLWVLLVTVIIVVRNTTPRLRTDQAIRFFWGPVSAVAVIAAALAWAGW